MDVVRTVPGSYAADRVHQTARTTLLALGFAVNTEGNCLRATGPGWRTNKQPALLGASRLELEVLDDRAELRADLGDLRQMQAFVILFPPGLLLILLVVFWTSGMIPLEFALSRGGAGVACFVVFFGLFSLTLRTQVLTALEQFLDGCVDGA